MPTSLQLATRGTRAIRYAGMATPQYRYAAAALRYGPTAARAAGRIAKWAYRRYRSRRTGYRSAKRARFSTIHIGEKVGTSSSKVNEQKNTSLVAKNTRTLYAQNLTTVTFGADRNERERGIINCRGFRICMAMVNDINVPMYANVAVIHQKDAETAPAETNFFRGPGAQRGQDFGNALTSLEFHCLPINTDKYVVLKHKRLLLAPDIEVTGDFNNNKGKNYANLDWYVKLKRQLRFDNSAVSTPTNGNVWLVYWFDTWPAAANATPTNTAVRVTERHLMYFHEPKKG